MLHVGNALPRKRLDVLFEVFARLRARFPELVLVQKGAELEPATHAQLDRLGVAGAVAAGAGDRRRGGSPRRRALAALYQGAELLSPASRGLRLPRHRGAGVGPHVVASDMPVLREVGGDAVTFCPVGGVEAWAEAAPACSRSRANGPAPEARRRAPASTWRRHVEPSSTVRSGFCEGLVRQPA